MPHAIENTLPKASRGLRQLQNSYDESRALLDSSPLSKSIPQLLPPKSKSQITKVVSLGLGTFATKNQSRVFKQLAILLSIVEQLKATSKTASIELFAQDPTFTRIDEAFLKSLGFRILHTPSSSELGEAGTVIGESTLIYSPFLTIDAYKLVFRTSAVEYLIGDDFDALKVKWPKHAAERNEVEELIKGQVSKLKRRAIIRGGVDGFWQDEDKPFPMAVYWRQQERIEGLKGAGSAKGVGRSRKTLEKL